MRTLVSILIPTYNAQEWIAETIQSALAQTWPRKEIIIVDDGSTDATLSVARQYECSTLKVIHQENRGACSARNRAFQECQGNYIQWLDADDLLAADKIERQLVVAESLTDPYILYASAWGTFYYRASKARFHPTPIWQDLDPVEWLVLRLANPWMINPSAWLVSRRLTDKAAPWDERLMRDQDGEYFCRIVSLSRYVKFVLESRCYYRIANLSSVSNTRSRKAWESIYLSTTLTIGHVLAREDSERTRQACVTRLNMIVSLLQTNAPDLADRLRQQIIKLGGEVVPKSTTMKYALVQRIIGERRARRLKRGLWKTQRCIAFKYDRWLAKLFKHSI
jgi:glycosyltransferase involved in cell wall biosynthesis